MILPDVNVLINAFRPDAKHHAVCRAWLSQVVEGDARFGLSPLALAAVIRVTSTRHIYDMPSMTEEAFGFCQDLRALPHCQTVSPGDRHWDIFRRLCVEAGIRGAMVSDA